MKATKSIFRITLFFAALSVAMTSSIMAQNRNEPILKKRNETTPCVINAHNRQTLDRIAKDIFYGHSLRMLNVAPSLPDGETSDIAVPVLRLSNGYVISEFNGPIRGFGSSLLYGFFSAALLGRQSDQRVHRLVRMLDYDIKSTIHYKEPAMIQMISAESKQFFGIPLVRKVRTFKSENYARQRLCFYNGQGMKRGFESLYLRPDTPILGTIAGKIYRIAFSKYVKLHLPVYAQMITRKNFVNAASRDYLRALERGRFSAHSFLRQKIIELDNLMGSNFSRSDNPERKAVILGIIIRRNIDGSLPVLNEIILKILKDYEPGLYRKYINELSFRKIRPAHGNI